MYEIDKAHFGEFLLEQRKAELLPRGIEHPAAVSKPCN